MKNIILLSIFFIVTIVGCKDDTVTPTPTPTKLPVLTITYFNIHNWIIGWGVDFQVKLKNIGEANATNIMLKFNYTATNNTFYYRDSVTNVQWGDTIIPTQEQYKVFSYNLPTGYYVDSARVTIVSYQ